MERIHRQIVLDLTIRTLERDRKYINHLKMHRAFENWYEEKIKELNTELRKTKSDLYKQGAKILTQTVDGDFTIYEILDRGSTYERRYSNIALRNWCEEETKRLLELPYRTTASG